MFLIGLSANFIPYLMVVMFALVWVGNANEIELSDNLAPTKVLEFAHSSYSKPDELKTISYHQAQPIVADQTALTFPKILIDDNCHSNKGSYHHMFTASFSGVCQSLRASPFVDIKPIEF